MIKSRKNSAIGLSAVNSTQATRSPMAGDQHPVTTTNQAKTINESVTTLPKLSSVYDVKTQHSSQYTVWANIQASGRLGLPGNSQMSAGMSKYSKMFEYIAENPNKSFGTQKRFFNPSPDFKHKV